LAAPLTYSLRSYDSDFVVFCFAKPEDAEAFAKRFGGERLPTGSRRQAGDPIALFSNERKLQNISSCRRTGPIEEQRCSLVSK
jgi:hypothetical protein